MLDVRDSAVFLDVDVEPVGLKVLRDHHAGLNYATFLWQISLAEILQGAEMHVLADLRRGTENERGSGEQGCRVNILTVSLCEASDTVLPTSLLVHSWVKSLELSVIPGMMRGML